jgi:hypothetical protein
MTLRTTVVNEQGTPIQNAYVSANLQVTGASFTRYTDGNGYADVALFGDLENGAPVTFLVQADGFKSYMEYMTIDGSGDREVSVTLIPFV